MSTLGPFFIPHPETPKENMLYEALNGFWMATKGMLNRGIRFEDNVDCRMLTYTSNGTPDTEDTVVHTLGKVPTGYIVYGQDKGGSVYTGTTAWTTTNLYLKCTVATVAYKLIIF